MCYRIHFFDTRMSDYLLKLQLGPVQDFIAAARSTRDLWSGSYLLSWLMASGIRELTSQGGSLVFPNPENQPLLANPAQWNPSNQEVLIPNLPNIVVAKISCDDPTAIATSVEKSIRDEWNLIAHSVWKEHAELGISPDFQDRFDSQIQQHLSIDWQITPVTNGYTEAFRTNGWHLDAARQLRTFNAAPIFPNLPQEKDSLTGKNETITSGKNTIAQKYQHLFKHPNDQLSAITLVKRLWHLTYLGQENRPKADSHSFPIPSTRGIAMREKEEDIDENIESLPGEKYLAAIAFDGDSIGKWIGGNFHSDDQLEEFHSKFSQALSTFALKKVPNTVTAHDGFLIYAGGDDVLALVPADDALSLAQALRSAFREATSHLGINNNSPDASAGIAIAHFKSPLQDIIREAQKAEKRAKTDLNRSAFAITLMKHSGETNHWGAKWDHGAIPLYDAILDGMLDGKLSHKFPHRICQLLAPYQIHTSNENQTDSVTPEQGKEIILKEFAHACRQHGSANTIGKLTPLIETYLSKLPENFQIHLGALIGLCTTVAFIHRNIDAKQNMTVAPSH